MEYFGETEPNSYGGNTYQYCTLLNGSVSDEKTCYTDFEEAKRIKLAVTSVGVAANIEVVDEWVNIFCKKARCHILYSKEINSILKCSEMCRNFTRCLNFGEIVTVAILRKNIGGACPIWTNKKSASCNAGYIAEWKIIFRINFPEQYEMFFDYINLKGAISYERAT